MRAAMQPERRAPADKQQMLPYCSKSFPMLRSLMTAKEGREEFRSQFRRSLRKCMQMGFSVEECFGVIWEETLERTNLPESEHAGLFAELIAWAKRFAAKNRRASA